MSPTDPDRSEESPQDANPSGGAGGPAEDYTPFAERFDEGVSGSPRLDPTLPAIDATVPLDPDESDDATLHLTPDVPVADVGIVIPGVTLGAIIGQGGQGTVYRGRQAYVDRDVAVKVLASGANASFADRFRREAKLLAGMQHPSVVACYDAGISEAGHCFITMEFIDGPDLAAHIKTCGALGTREALELVRDVAGALEYALKSGVIHRDVKPQNVLLQLQDSGDDSEPTFRPKLADLGLARVTGDQEGQAMLTVPGAVMGTPATMALEQIDDPDSVDHRADIYGLGCVLYHALAGESAYRGLRPSQVFKKKAQEPAPDIRVDLPNLAPGVAVLVRCMMDGDREQRPQSYPELIARLHAELALLEAPAAPGPMRRTRLVGLLAAVALLTVVALVIVLSTGDTPADPQTQPDSQTGSMEAAPAEAPETSPPPTDPTLADVQPAEEQAPALMPGSDTVLFAGWEEADQLLAGWETTQPDVWIGFSSDYSQPMARVAAGVATATRALPGGSWRLTGEIKVQPVYGQAKEKMYRGGLRIGYQAGHWLDFVVSIQEQAGRAAWALGALDDQAALPDEVVGPEAMSFKRGVWIPFWIDCQGPVVRLRIGEESTSLRAIELATLDLVGPAKTLTLTAQGNVIWKNFVLRGL